jgi:hypothetical protein
MHELTLIVRDGVVIKLLYSVTKQNSRLTEQFQKENSDKPYK